MIPWIRTVSVLSLITAAFTGHTLAGEPPAAAEEVYSKALSDGAKVVVARKEVPFGNALKSLLKVDPRQLFRAYVVTLELRSPGTAAVPLGSKLYWAPAVPAPRFAVLDMAIEGGDIVTAIAGNAGIGIWRIQLGRVSEDAFAWLSPEWRVKQMAEPLTRDSVKLTLSHRQDGRWEVGAIEIVPGNPIDPPARYVQDGKTWKFEFVGKGEAGGGAN